MFKTTRKVLGFVFRPGFTKNNCNPFEVSAQGAQLVRSAYNAKKETVNSEKEALSQLQETFFKANATPQQRFAAWVNELDVKEHDLLTLEHQQNVMGYLNYMVLILGLAIMVHIANPTTDSFISNFTNEHKWLFVFADLMFCIASFFRAIKYMHYKYSIRERSLYGIKHTLYNIKRWL